MCHLGFCILHAQFQQHINSYCAETKTQIMKLKKLQTIMTLIDLSLGNLEAKSFKSWSLPFLAVFGNTEILEANAYHNYKNIVGKEVTCSKKTNLKAHAAQSIPKQM